jgi:hypothetical protein
MATQANPENRDFAQPPDAGADLCRAHPVRGLLPAAAVCDGGRIRFKPLDEIRQGGMLNLPQVWTIEPWLSAWSTAQIGVQPTGLKPFFLNSILMVVPAVAISTMMGALNGYVLTKWQFAATTSSSGCCCSPASSRSRSC